MNKFAPAIGSLRATGLNPENVLGDDFPLKPPFGALAVGDDAVPIKQWLIQGRNLGESSAQQPLEQAKKSRELGADVDSVALTRYLAVLLQDLCVQMAS